MRIFEWDEEREKEWDEWVTARPPVIQDLCKRFPPYNLYRLKNTDHKVTLASYAEDGTLMVNITGEYNAVMFDRQVFGIEPNDLEECALPKPDEVLGTVLTEKDEIEAHINKIRPQVLGEERE